MNFNIGSCENELTLEALIGFFMMCLLWLTYLTHKLRQQALENRKLLHEIEHLNKLISQYVQKEAKKNKAKG